MMHAKDMTRTSHRTMMGAGEILSTLSFTVLLSVSAFVKIPLPFTPIPVTLQTLVVLLAAGLLGPVRGFSAVFLYILLGAAGVPLFANAGAGSLYLSGPTGGYLLGFLAAAWVVGGLLRSSEARPVIGIYAAMLTGIAIIYVSGGAWLMFVWRWDGHRIFTLGMAPFIAGDAAKAFLAAVVTRGLARRRRDVL